MRIDRDNNNKIQFFDVYGPKILASRKSFYDKATESRCMTEVMTGTSRKDIPPNIDEDFNAEADIIRNKLLLWRFRNYQKIDPRAGKDIDLSFLEPRLRQVNTGFLALFVEGEVGQRQEPAVMRSIP